MSDATRKTKLARGVAAWTLRCAHSGAALVGMVVLGLAAIQVARHGPEGLRPTHLAADYGLVAAQTAEQETEAGTEPAPAAQAVVSLPTMDGVTRYVSQKYRVSRTAVEPLVTAAQQVGRSMGVDPILLIAVMAIESRFNPFAESSVGAQGLMQVVPRFHEDKLEDGEDRSDFLDPETNIRIGARILKDSIRQAGSVMGGLQRYNGNPGDPAQSYANKVMAEKQRISQALGQRQRAAHSSSGSLG